jgi:predicted ArsR family transcriptional regulator
MFKIAHHPKAFLTLKRNIQPGLSARTQIISVLEKGACDAKKISKETGLSYAVVLYHLHLLEAENILNRRGRGSYVWRLTGVGQQRLIGGKEAKRGIHREIVHT